MRQPSPRRLLTDLGETPAAVDLAEAGTAAGIAVPVVVVGALIAAYLRKEACYECRNEAEECCRSKRIARQGRNARDGAKPNVGAATHCGGGSQGCCRDAAPSEVYYSEIADGPQLDADGYVVDGSTSVAPTEPVCTQRMPAARKLQPPVRTQHQTRRNCMWAVRMLHQEPGHIQRCLPQHLRQPRTPCQLKRAGLCTKAVRLLPVLRTKIAACWLVTGTAARSRKVRGEEVEEQMHAAQMRNDTASRREYAPPPLVHPIRTIKKGAV